MNLLDLPSNQPARLPTPSAGDPRLARLSLNQWTTRHWPMPDLIAGVADAGLQHVGLWRGPVEEYGLRRSRDLVRAAGLGVSSLCRGGFLTGVDEAAVMADNRAAVEEAAALEADCLVLVVGGLDVIGGRLPIDAARAQVADRLAALAEVSAAEGVRLALEPLHPMYCADRAVISTLGQALDLAENHPADVVGVVVDTYHVWWDPDLRRQIARAAGRIASYQLAEWVLPLAADPLLSRGMMGDGYVDFGPITGWVRDAGYDGAIEVEIFNEELWAAEPRQVLDTCLRRYVEHVQPQV